MKGCICLDIDGTITADPFSVPKPVLEFFEKLYFKGWQFLFSTGRPYAFASQALSSLNFPHFLSLQNGADILQMPEKKLLSKEHLSSSFIPNLEKLYEEIEEDFLIYAGIERGDFCYYRPDRFSKKMLEHLELVQSIVKEKWEAKDKFTFPHTDSFPLIKGIGTKKDMESLCNKLQSFKDLHATFIKNPLAEGDSYFVLITSSKATKGEVIKKLRKMLPDAQKFIAAGDDHNDVSMLKEADVAIVMKTAPKTMHGYAHVLAESAKEHGIIQALLEATGEML